MQAEPVGELLTPASQRLSIQWIFLFSLYSTCSWSLCWRHWYSSIQSKGTQNWNAISIKFSQLFCFLDEHIQVRPPLGSRVGSVHLLLKPFIWHFLKKINFKLYWEHTILGSQIYQNCKSWQYDSILSLSLPVYLHMLAYTGCVYTYCVYVYMFMCV